MMSPDHFYLEMLLKTWHHAAYYTLKMSETESALWATTATWKLKNRLLNV